MSKLSVGIVGLPNVGKSTLFNALTKASVPAENYPFCTIDPSIGVVGVPDARLEKLAEFSKSEKVIFGGHKALAVNSPIKKFTSEVGHRLCRKNPPFSIVWYAEKGELHVSLRGNGNFDVSKIAARFNGGGHRDAAGFSVPFRAKLPWRVLKTQQEK